MRNSTIQGNRPTQPPRRVSTLQTQPQLHPHAFCAGGMIQPLASGNAFSIGKHSKRLEVCISGTDFLNLVCKRQFWKAGGPAASQTISLHDS